MDIRFGPCPWEDLRELATSRLRARNALMDSFWENHALVDSFWENHALVDSFWENHVLEASHYRMRCGEETAGHFAIHGSKTLVLFDVLPPLAGRWYYNHDAKKGLEAAGAYAPARLLRFDF